MNENKNISTAMDIDNGAITTPSSDTTPERQKRGKKRKLNTDDDEADNKSISKEKRAPIQPKKKRKIIHGEHDWLNKLVNSKRVLQTLCSLHDEMSGISNLNRKRDHSWIQFYAKILVYLLLWQMTLDMPNLAGNIINLLRKYAEYIQTHKVMDIPRKWDIQWINHQIPPISISCYKD